jgi:hypothetical protein
MTHLPLARLALHLYDVLQGNAAAAGGGEQQRLREVLQFCRGGMTRGMSRAWWKAATLSRHKRSAMYLRVDLELNCGNNLMRLILTRCRDRSKTAGRCCSGLCSGGSTPLHESRV